MCLHKMDAKQVECLDSLLYILLKSAPHNFFFMI